MTLKPNNAIHIHSMLLFSSGAITAYLSRAPGSTTEFQWVCVARSSIFYVVLLKLLFVLFSYFHLAIVQFVHSRFTASDYLISNLFLSLFKVQDQLYYHHSNVIQYHNQHSEQLENWSFLCRFYLSDMYAAIRRKKNWLARNQDSVFEWNNISTIYLPVY